MSSQSLEYLRNNVMVDVTRHGPPWHADRTPGVENPNLYDGPIPIDDIVTRLFPWEPMGLDLRMVIPDGTEVPSDVAERLVEQGFIIPDYKVWVRDDTFEVMGLHSDGYVGHGYKRWLVDAVGEIVHQSNDKLTVASAGTLDEGAKAWVEISMPEHITSKSGVELRTFLLATTSLDGSIATTYKVVSMLVVCDNTRAIALGENSPEYKVKHTRNSEVRLLDAANALDILITAGDTAASEIDEQTTRKVTPKQFTKFLDTVVPMPDEDYAKREGSDELIVLNKRAVTMAERKRDSLIYLYNNDERVAPWKGTAFGVLQMMNTYEHHESRANKGTVRLERNMLRTLKGEYDSLDRENYRVLETVLA